MDIEVKRMSPTAVEMLDQLSAVCKRFGVDYYAASQNQRDLLDSIALHEYQLKKAHEQGLKRSEVPPKGSTAVDNAPPHPQTIRFGDFLLSFASPEQQAGNFTLIGVFFPWRVWYTWFSATNRNWEARIMWNELGISGGTAIIILIALYYVIKWAVRNGIKEAYRAITGEKTDEDIQNEKELKELGLDSDDK